VRHPETGAGRGHRQLIAGRGGSLLGHGAPDLECEQRIAENGLDEPAKTVPRQAQPVALREEAAHRSQAERADFELIQARPLHEVGRVTGAPREQEGDGLVSEPARGKCERGGRRRIEPLHVVDGGEKRPASGQRTQGVEQSHGDRLRLGVFPRGLGAQERNVEGVALRRRRFLQRAVSTSSRRSTSAPNENCASASVGRAGARRAPSPWQARPGFPERGLADPGPADEHKSPRSVVAPQERLEQGNLRLPPTTDVRPSSLVTVATDLSRVTSRP